MTDRITLAGTGDGMTQQDFYNDFDPHAAAEFIAASQEVLIDTGIWAAMEGTYR